MTATDARPVRRRSTTHDLPGIEGLRRAVAFEWTKLWTVRSTWWSLIAVGVLTVGISLVIGLSASASARKGIDAAQPAPHAAAGIVLLIQLIVVVIATLAVTGEYATRSIFSTLQSVPARGRMLTGKTLVVAGSAFAIGLIASVTGTLSVAPLMGRQGEFTAAQALATALGVATYLAALASVTIGIGFFLRSAAGTLTGMIMLLLVVPQILGFLRIEWVRLPGDLLPDVAGGVLMTQATDPYGTGTAIGVLTLWAAAALGGGYLALRSRDA